MLKKKTIKYQQGGEPLPKFLTDIFWDDKQVEQIYIPKTLDIKDGRKVRRTTGKPLNPNVDSLSGEYDKDFIEYIVSAAKSEGVDPYTALAVALQETGLDPNGNVGHIIGDQDVELSGNDVYDFVKILKYKAGEYADKIGIDKNDEERRIQAYNGFGRVKPSTEADYHGFNMKKIYGVPLSEKGIDMKENPLYGRQIIDIRDNVLKGNKDLVNLVENTKPMSLPVETKSILKLPNKVVKDEKSINFSTQEVDTETRTFNRRPPVNMSTFSRHPILNPKRIRPRKPVNNMQQGGDAGLYGPAGSLLSNLFAGINSNPLFAEKTGYTGSWDDNRAAIKTQLFEEDKKKYGVGLDFEAASKWADETGTSWSNRRDLLDQYNRNLQDRAGQKFDTTNAAVKPFNDSLPIAKNLAGLFELNNLERDELANRKDTLADYSTSISTFAPQGFAEEGGEISIENNTPNLPSLQAILQGLPKEMKAKDKEKIAVNANKELQQILGYKDNSPFKNKPSIDIYSDTIDTGNMAFDIQATSDNGISKTLQPNSGLHYFPGANKVTEVPRAEEGGMPDRYKEMGFDRVGQKKESTRDGKKWMVLAKKGDKYKVVHGGADGMQDYSQHGDKDRRDRFWDRMGGKDSAKANDPFSPLYWHSKKGTW